MATDTILSHHKEGRYPDGYHQTPVGQEYITGGSYQNTRTSTTNHDYPTIPAGYSGFGPPMPRPPPLPINKDWKDDNTQTFSFDDPYKRRAFIRKVYAILMLQMLITAAIIAVFMIFEDLILFVQKHSWLCWVLLAVNLCTLIVLSCCTSLRRKVPMNYIFLFIFTITSGLLLGFMTSQHQTSTIILSVIITAALCLALTLFAFQTKWDFTVRRGMLLCALVVLFIFGITAFLLRSRIMTLVFSCVAALIFSFYLVYDTQVMIGGKHKYSISPAEYIFAALSLYIDIINIFIQILSIVTAARGE